jgi:hypothetical protein
MAWIEGEAADEITREVERQNKEQLAEALGAAKAEAQQRGKEPFDARKLRDLYEPEFETDASLESKYYLLHPDVMTLAEFAQEVKEIDWWTHGR